jgi:hypothetical protein
MTWPWTAKTDGRSRDTARLLTRERATAFEFISTQSHLAKVRAFMARFPDIVGR